MEFSPDYNKEKFAKSFVGFFFKVDLTNVRSSCMCRKQSGAEVGREETLYILVIQNHLSFAETLGNI